MINEKMEKAFNSQINKEFYSAYLYLSMSAYMQSVGLSGFSGWLRIQAQEEIFHATTMFDYVLERGGNIKLEAVDTPAHSWINVLHVFEEILTHEQYVTELINELADVADEVKDRASLAFLQWFINEQVEEEATVTDIVAKLKLKLINLNGDALFTMDKDMSARVFIAPVIK